MCYRFLVPLLQSHLAAGLLSLGLAFAVPARADDLADFNAAVEVAMRHHRAALGFLRADEPDLTRRELGKMREAWGRVTAQPRPAAFRDNALYGTTMLETATRLVGIFLVLDMGRPNVAADSLVAIRASLYSMRRASGAPVLADCILDSNTAMQALSALDGRPLDGASAELTTLSDAYRSILQRCDEMAGADIRANPALPRLIDSARASLSQMQKAIDTRDSELLNRLLRELRAIDIGLALRFG